MFTENSKHLSIFEIKSQILHFFLGGFGLSSSAMTFALFELAKNQEIQLKLRTEIDMILTKYSSSWSYTAFSEMKYLDQIIDETLRMYPSYPFLTRSPSENWKIPGHDVSIEKNTLIIFSIYSLHNDPRYYPNPELFDPERFSQEAVANRAPNTYMPFSMGPRN